jgi:peptidyl-prolyl cis-trans isomerase SurA
VTADYQEEMEKAWVNELRKRYTVVVNDDVLDTVNKHN